MLSKTSRSILFALLCHQGANAFAPQALHIDASSLVSTKSSSQLYMQPSNHQDRLQLSDLSAMASNVEAFYGDMDESLYGSSSLDTEDRSSIPDASTLEKIVLPVLGASMMVTGNTVGAGMLVLPELAAEPGMAVSSTVMLVAYLMNWLSGLCIAQVAIQQHEDSGNDVPSSFKEFAQANLFDSAALIVSGISIFVNSLVLAFDTTKAGQVGAGLLSTVAPIDGPTMAYVWAALVFSIVSTQSLEKLSQLASMMVMILFMSFAGLLLPGLTHVSDPLSVLATGPPTDGSIDVMEKVLHMAPVFVTTLVYQNVVPTVTRMLNYDRTKVVSAITLGSVLPFLMYIAWCITVVGGGVASGVEMPLVSNPLLVTFSLVTVGGSSIGALMSLSEEFEILLGKEKNDTFSSPSVALPMVMALGLCQVFASDINDALQVAGSFGSPLLYGLIPVAMAYSQQQQKKKGPPESTSKTVIPGGVLGMGILGMGATGLIGSELASIVNQCI